MILPDGEELKNWSSLMQIFDALLRRDGNLAQALMSAHLQGVESYWKGLIGGIDAERREPALERA